MNYIYYIEINLVCIIVLFLIIYQLKNNQGKISTSDKLLNYIVICTILFCFSDICAGCLRGQMFKGAKILIEISNLIYFEMITLISYLWMIFVFVELHLLKNFRSKGMFFWAIPLILFTLIAITNPLTDFLFEINENNLYVRGDGVFLHWIIGWMYLIVATIIVIKRIKEEKNKNIKRELYPMLIFIIAPIIASVLQMIFYGVTCLQVGITISIVLMFLSLQQNQIVTDALTGLNNRFGLLKYLNEYILSNNKKVSLFMVDINGFKKINDKFGHIVGDKALVEVANVLKNEVAKVEGKTCLCRFGGDEFVFVINEFDSQNIDRLKKEINNKLEEINEKNESTYKLSVSIGIASGLCANNNDVDSLIQEADGAMYLEKNKN